MDDNNKTTKIIGIKHWLFQITPPLLMFGILFTTDKGPAMVFLAGFLIFPVLFSLISIIAKLIFFKKRKYFLLRPLLTIIVFILILSIANQTYSTALDQAIAEAQKIHQICNEKQVCPEHPDGWQVDGKRIRKNDLGFWLKYSASYYYEKEGFNIRVYQGPDMGDHITGGVNMPFKTFPYTEN